MRYKEKVEIRWQTTASGNCPLWKYIITMLGFAGTKPWKEHEKPHEDEPNKVKAPLQKLWNLLPQQLWWEAVELGVKCRAANSSPSVLPRQWDWGIEGPEQHPSWELGRKAPGPGTDTCYSRAPSSLCHPGSCWLLKQISASKLWVTDRCFQFKISNGEWNPEGNQNNKNWF